MYEPPLSQEMLDQMGDVPLGQPPSGVEPDYTRREWHGQPVMIAAGICITLMVIFAAIRFYYKILILRKWRLDDYMFSIAFPSTIAYILVQVVIFQQGAFGYHQWEVHINDMTFKLLQLTRVAEIMSGPVTWFIKATLLCLILEAFNPITWLRRSAYVGLATTAVFYLTVSIIYGVTCRPVGGTDRLALIKGLYRSECMAYPGINTITMITHGAFNILSDLYIFAIPLPAIAKLHLHMKKKVGIFLLFGSGFAACITSMFGLRYRLPQESDDMTYSLTYLIMWMIIELGVGVMIPCMTVFPKFYQHISPSLKDFISSTAPSFSRRDRGSSKESLQSSSNASLKERTNVIFITSHFETSEEKSNLSSGK